MYSLRKRYAAFALAAAWFCLATGCSNHRRNTNTTNEDAAPLDIPFPPCEFQGALRTIGCDLRRLADIGYAPPPLISATLPDYRLVRIAQEAYTASDKVMEKAYSRLRCLLGETQCFAVEVESPCTVSQRALRQTSAAVHASTDEAHDYLFKRTKKFTMHLTRMPAEEKQRLKQIINSEHETINFPPSPPSKYAIKNMVTACAKRMEFSAIQEAGCAVCGQLVVKTELSKLKAVKFLVRANKMVVNEENLAQYNDDVAPVTIQYKVTESAKASGTPAVNDMEEEDGTEEGPCPFVMHGLTGAQMEEMSNNALKTLALQYFSQSGRVLAIGQAPNKVALVKKNNRVTGLSPVFDYVYRPDSLESMSLYDWAIRCTRVKPKKKKAKRSSTPEYNDDGNEDSETDNEELDKDDEDTEKFLSGSKRSKNLMLDFQSEHPLSATHKCALMLETNKKVAQTVLNFMSAPPRQDQGDREYYCSVMLALFLPWRSGEELKDKDQTWDEAFVSREFSAQHVQIMNNFNLRYECLDAKDDFRTQMKTGVSSELSLPLSDDHYVVNQCDDELDGILANNGNFDLQLEVDKMCASALRREKAIKSMKALMQNSHWATPLSLQKSVSLNKRLETGTNLPRKSPREWRQIVLSLRQQVMERQKQSGSVTSDLATLNTSHNKDYNYVKVVDKSYLEAAYIPSVHRPL
ncbi:hypothetical protein EYR40_002550 [Pleurotus pulmonarius]|nr:hypothetical protein EYR40_002550 [Pleurotus pulmonarius]